VQHRVGRTLGISGEIADGREPEARYHRIRYNVHVLVYFPRAKSVVQTDVTIARHHLAVDHVRKLPLLAWNDRALRVPRIPNGQHVARIVRIRYRILRATDFSGDEVPQWSLVRFVRKHEVAAQ